MRILTCMALPHSGIRRMRSAIAKQSCVLTNCFPFPEINHEGLTKTCTVPIYWDHPKLKVSKILERANILVHARTVPV
jgi:hypothetical protein